MINMEGLQIISLSKKDSFKLFNSQSLEESADDK